MTSNVRTNARMCSTTAALVAALLLSTAALSAPAIRTSEANRVPACVSPERLMAFLEERNGGLDPRYRDIARWYKHYGEAWNVRWDYAFFQMALETNYLKYKRGNGRRGDVHEKQNNFAGIGATGGGVAGERFPDVKTGVHAQIQHLVAYSGERVQDPVAKRTDENQDSIIEKSRRLRREVTFGDLARRWAADRQYAKSIDIVASMFREGHCHGPATADAADQPHAGKAFAKPAGLGGPKPLKLAGPETLPWDDGLSGGGARTTAQSEQRPAAAPEPQSSSSPVRTLWSRGKGFESPRTPQAPGEPPVVAKSPAAAHVPGQAPAAAPRSVAVTPVRPSSEPAGAGEQARLSGSMSAEPQSAENDTVELPTFRIAPRVAEPSRLGGPVEVATPEAAGRPALPQGTFVEFEPPKLVTRRERHANAAAAISPGAPPAETASIGDCRILTASYGGKKTLLVHAEKGGMMQLTALTVLDGFENSMLASYAKTSAPGAKLLGTFDSKDDALVEAKSICPSG